MSAETLYILTEEDAQNVAQKEFDTTLTEEEMYMVKKGIESGLGFCWYDIMKTAVEEAIGERK